MAECRLTDYRFSISRSRVLPMGSGRPNEAGLAFYDALVDSLLERWDPTDRDPPSLGPPSASFRVGRLGGSCWLTLNEPAVLAFHGNANGIHEPVLCSCHSPCVSPTISCSRTVRGAGRLRGRSRGRGHRGSVYPRHGRGRAGDGRATRGSSRSARETVIGLTLARPATSRRVRSDLPAAAPVRTLSSWRLDPFMRIRIRHPDGMVSRLRHSAARRRSMLRRADVDSAGPRAAWQGPDRHSPGRRPVASR